MILIRAGYRFFGDISISSVIARSSYEYFRAIANILRTENGADLTYFLEYYMTALSAAVNDLRSKREQQELDAVKEERRMAIMPLSTRVHDNRTEAPTVNNTSNSSLKGSKAKHQEQYQVVSEVLEKLREQGHMYFTIADISALTGIDRKQINKLLQYFESDKQIISVKKSKSGNIYAFPEENKAGKMPDSENVDISKKHLRQ